MPDSLAHRIELFRARGKVARFDGQLFSDASWIAVLLGQHVVPERWDPIADTLPISELLGNSNALREKLHGAIARMPTHAQFIENSCKAPALA